MSQSSFGLGLTDPERAGVFQADAADLDTLGALARDAGLQLHRIDLAGCTGKHTLLLRLSTQLDFPSGFGRNWDALADALRDLSWLPPATSGHALLLDAADDLRQSAPEDYGTLVDVLDEACVFWRDQGRVFTVFIGLSVAG